MFLEVLIQNHREIIDLIKEDIPFRLKLHKRQKEIKKLPPHVMINKAGKEILIKLK